MSENFNAQQCMSRGIELMKQDDYQQARQFLEQAADQEPIAYNYYQLGLCYFKLNMSEAALQAFQSATIMDPQLWQALVYQGSILYDFAQYSSAVESFITSLKYYQEFDMFDILNLKVITENRKNLKDLYLKYGDKIYSEPNHKLALLFRSIVGVKLGKYQQSLKDFQKLQKLFEENQQPKSIQDKNKLNVDYFKLKNMLNEGTLQPVGENQTEKLNQALMESQGISQIDSSDVEPNQPLMNKEEKQKQNQQLEQQNNIEKKQEQEGIRTTFEQEKQNNNNNNAPKNQFEDSNESVKSNKNKEKQDSQQPCCQCQIF